jgi:hypothetical protein
MLVLSEEDTTVAFTSKYHLPADGIIVDAKNPLLPVPDEDKDKLPSVGAEKLEPKGIRGFKVLKLLVQVSVVWSIDVKPFTVQSLPFPEVSSPNAELS